MTIRQAVLLVGGRGTRMWPLTEDVPKALLPVAGTPFVELQLRQLADAGVDEVILAVGTAQLPSWEDHVDRRTGPPDVRVSVEPEPLDTAGGVRMAVADLDERFAVLNGDVVVETDLGAFFRSAPETSAATIALVEVEDPSSYGVVVARPDGVVERFVEKPPREDAPAQTVNAGVYVMSRDAIVGYEDGPLSFERTVFPDLVRRTALSALVIHGVWLDIGTPELYLACTGALLRGESRLSTFDTSHVVEQGAEMTGHTEGGWSYVAAGARVATDAVVEEAVVLPGATVDAGARVSRAIVGWSATVGRGAKVTDAAMVGTRASVGAGCEIGEGMRIAPDAVLGPGAVTFSPPE